jgi:hypothetical protein
MKHVSKNIILQNRKLKYVGEDKNFKYYCRIIIRFDGRYVLVNKEHIKSMHC